LFARKERGISVSFIDYTKIDHLGSGGNGNVFLMKDSAEKKVAVKVSKINDESAKNNKWKQEKLERFKIEALAVYKMAKENQRGIIPITDYALPDKNTGKYFFVMPVAVPLKKKLKRNEDIYKVIKIFKELSEILEELHAKGISHRDIKPDNILFYDNGYCFGDFGLIDFPEKQDLTTDYESIGNRKTIAPEMRIAKKVKNARPADVYSLAKTLWMILTGEKYAFDGRFDYTENLILQEKYPSHHLVELLKLLADSTYENPDKRPSISEFLRRLIEWEEISLASNKAAESEWKFIEENVINQYVPNTVIWNKESDVINIVKRLSRINFNHTFIPTGGGMDLINIEKVDYTNEENLLELDFGYNSPEIFKLKRLVWEMPNDDFRFSYFRLELDELKPIFPKVLEQLGERQLDQYKENLTVNTEGDFRAYNEIEWSVTRWLKGAFLIVPKGSVYNRISETYDARHAGLSTDEFREYMELLQFFYTNENFKKYFRKIASFDPTENNILNELRVLKEKGYIE